MNPLELAKLINNQIAVALKDIQERTFYRGIVSGVNGVFVDVKIEGAEQAVPNIICLDGYIPAIDDQVFLISLGKTRANFIVLGKIPGSEEVTNIAFRAIRTSGLSLGASTWTDLAPPTVEYNYGDCYDDASGKFVVPFDGVYHFNMQGNFTACERIITQIRIDNADNSVGFRGADFAVDTGSNARSTSVAVDVGLEQGQEVEAFVWGDDGGNVTGHFAGHLVMKAPVLPE